MNFDFSEDQKLLRDAARKFLDQQSPLSLCRAVFESNQSYSDTLWKAAAEQGWQGTAIPEQYGGAGYGRLELAVIAEEIGRALAPIPFASSAYFAADAIVAAGSNDQKQRYLPKLASGAAIGTFAHSEKAGDLGSRLPATTLTNGKLKGRKLPVPDGDVAHFALVTAKSGKDIGLAIVELTDSSVKRKALTSIDPSRSLASIRFEDTPAEWLGGAPCGQDTINRIFDRAAVLMAFEQLGSAQRAFDITREFTLGRYAFGRPIASFQALKHRMADIYVEIELARSNCYYGAWALETDAPELGVAACGARVSATDALDLATEEMIQMHGGVGFTWEFDCHLFYRRGKWLSSALGSASAWRERLVQRLEA